MTTQWIVLCLLALLVSLNTIAIIALVRQIGLLHLRLSPVPALDGNGPPPGTEVVLETAATQALSSSRSQPETIIVGFISPTCSLCLPLLPAFHELARRLRPQERIVLVSDADAERTQEYASAKKIPVTVVSDPGAFKQNDIPGAPFVVVTDGALRCLASGGVNTFEQIESLLDKAEQERGAMRSDKERTDGHRSDDRVWLESPGELGQQA